VGRVRDKHAVRDWRAGAAGAAGAAGKVAGTEMGRRAETGARIAALLGGCASTCSRRCLHVGAMCTYAENGAPLGAVVVVA
jgi:uncharacterized metal-binding protein